MTRVHPRPGGRHDRLRVRGSRAPFLDGSVSVEAFEQRYLTAVNDDSVLDEVTADEPAQLNPMTDERAREGERRSLASGSPADEAVVLRERLRRGELEERTVRVAAQLGHVAAATGLGIEGRPTPTSFPEIQEWVPPIAEDPRATRILLRELAAEVLPVWTRYASGELLERLLALADSATRQPTEEADEFERQLTLLGDSAYGTWTSGRQPLEELLEVFTLLHDELRDEATATLRAERIVMAAGHVLAMGMSTPTPDGVPLGRAADRAARALLGTR